MFSMQMGGGGGLVLTFVQIHYFGVHLDLQLITKSIGTFAAKYFNTVLKDFLQNIAAVQSGDGFHFTLCLNGNYFDVNVKC